MDWLIIRGTDPKFLELTESYRRMEASGVFPFSFPSQWEGEGLTRCLLFDSPRNRASILQRFDCPIRFISEIDPTSREQVVNLLGLQTVAQESKPQRRLTKAEIHAVIHLSGYPDGPSVDSGAAFLRFDIEVGFGMRSLGMWYSPFVVYFDRSPIECYHWARKFEETVRGIVPLVTLRNRVGLCTDCKTPLELEDHVRYGLGLFLCEHCSKKRAVQQRAKAEHVKEERRLKKIRKVPVPAETLLSSRVLHRVLHKAYRGRCQYCPRAETLPREATHIEHIIGHAIALENIPAILAKMGIAEELAVNFCVAFLPPRHDCVLNYTLACHRHNYEKGGGFFIQPSWSFFCGWPRRKRKGFFGFTLRRRIGEAKSGRAWKGREMRSPAGCVRVRSGRVWLGRAR